MNIFKNQKKWRKRKETTLWRTTEQALFSLRCKINSLFKTDFLRNRPPESTCPTSRRLQQAPLSSGQGPIKSPPQQEQPVEHLWLFNAQNWFYLFGMFVESISFPWCFAVIVTGDRVHLKSFYLPMGLPPLPTLANLIPLGAQMVKNLPARQGTWVWSLGWENPLEKEAATHSSILAWRIPWTEEAFKELDMTERLTHFFFFF